MPGSASRRVRLFAGLPRWLHAAFAPQAPGAPAQRLAVAGGLAERWLGISARRPIEIVADGFTAPALDATGTGAR
jgi:hypothetical protein